MRSFIQHILFYLILLGFCVLLAYSVLDKGEIMPLKGHIERVERPAFSISDWFNGTYQSKMDKRTQSKFGFRSVLIHLKNQIDYTFFDEIHAREVVEGKQGYLYEEAYIEAYSGKRFIGEKEIIKKAKKLKLLQDTLAKLDKTLVIVLAAGKASFYPQYFPAKYDTVKKTISNYSFYRQQLFKHEVDFIDFNDWFVQIKDTSQHSLFPKCGIHWSKYGECLVADSLIKYIEQKQQVDIPDFKMNGIQTISPPQFRDKDLEEAMNLLFPLDTKAMAYPNIYFDTKNKTKLNALIVADSYYWGLHNMGFSKEVFNHASFWFYNNEFFTTAGEYGKVADLDLLKETLNSNIIILMATEATLDSFAWRYINLLSQKFKDERGI